MDIQTSTLFLGFLLFSGFNVFVNLKANTAWLRVLTLMLGLASLFCAGYLLTISFINLIK